MNNFQGLYTYVALYYLKRKADSVLKFHHLANWKVSIWKPAGGHEDMSVTGGYGKCPLHLRELCAKWPLIDFLMWMSSFTPRGILTTDFKLSGFCSGAIRGFLLTCLISTYYRCEINDIKNFLRYVTSLHILAKKCNMYASNSCHWEPEYVSFKLSNEEGINLKYLRSISPLALETTQQTYVENIKFFILLPNVFMYIVKYKV